MTQTGADVAICKVCGREFPWSGFTVYRLLCKECLRERRREWSRAWRAKHPEKNLEHIRRASFKYHYGISLEAARAIYDAQGGKCALCVKSIPFDGRQRAIDHDHATGRVRGILCGTCNRILGHIEKLDVSLNAWVRRLHAYLKEPAPRH